MPRIDVAMARSLGRDVLQGLEGRDIVDTANNVKTSFSSWDNCMAAAYCKWPVIAAIIVGGLIVLSVVWCIIRCACCGLSCCCGCFSCLQCCGDCCGCCDAPNKKHKHLDEPYFPPPFPPPFPNNAGYKAPGAMMSGGASPYEPPKYAQFETGPNGMAIEPKKIVNDDALPPMPSWDSAAKKRISLEEQPGAVELGELDPATGQRVPLMTGAGPISRTASPAIGAGAGASGVSPYGAPAAAQSGYFSPNPNGGAALGVGAGALAGGAMAGAVGRGNDPYNRSPNPQDPRNYNDPYAPNQGGPNGAGPGYGRGYPPQNGNAPYNPSFPADQYGRDPYGADPYGQPNNNNNNYTDASYTRDNQTGLPYPSDPRHPSPPQGGAFGVIAGGYPNSSPNPNRSRGPYAEQDRQFSHSSDGRPLLPAGPLGAGAYAGGEEAYVPAGPRVGSPPVPMLANTSGYEYRDERRGAGEQVQYRGEAGRGRPSPPPGGRFGDARTGSPAQGQPGFAPPNRQYTGDGSGPARVGSPAQGQAGFAPPNRQYTGDSSSGPPSYASRSYGGGQGQGRGQNQGYGNGNGGGGGYGQGQGQGGRGQERW